MLVGMQTGIASMENSVEIPLEKTTTTTKHLGLELPYELEIPLLSIHPEDTRTEGDTCTPMFTEAVFTIART